MVSPQVASMSSNFSPLSVRLSLAKRSSWISRGSTSLPTALPSWSTAVRGSGGAGRSVLSTFPSMNSKTRVVLTFKELSVVWEWREPTRYRLTNSTSSAIEQCLSMPRTVPASPSSNTLYHNLCTVSIIIVVVESEVVNTKSWSWYFTLTATLCVACQCIIC